MEDIFSKNPIKEKPAPCPNPNTKIIIDTREKQSFIAANLFEQRVNLEFQKLDIGDYEIGKTIIERKTITDFISSMINKRLQEQLINLQKYEKRFLLIEGFLYDYENYRIHENSLRGMFLSVINDFKTPIIFTKDESDTSKFLILEAKKYEKKNAKTSPSIRPTKEIKSIEDQKKFILEGFQGVGPVNSEYLLQNFNNLRNIFNASKEDLEKYSGLDKNKINKFIEILED